MKINSFDYRFFKNPIIFLKMRFLEDFKKYLGL